MTEWPRPGGMPPMDGAPDTMASWLREAREHLQGGLEMKRGFDQTRESAAPGNRVEESVEGAMTRFEEAVRRWRDREERGSSLATGELDELEDHLRARAVLEMELDGALGPARAVMLAAEGMGDAAALEREFAKAGKPRWRRWLGVGWGLWGVSWWLPALSESPWPFSSDAMPGYEAFWAALDFWSLGFDPVATSSALTNLLIPAGLLALWRGGARRRLRWLKPLTSGAAVWNLWWLSAGDSLGIGYYAWLASFFCLAVGLWLRDPGRPGRVREVAKGPGTVHSS